jgi:hypothetical protein
MVDRDPDIVLGWLAGRIDRERLPDRQAVVEVAMRHRSAVHRGWIVLARGEEPYGCLEDPALDDGRPVYLECSAATLLGVARGRQSLHDALADGAVRAFGDPDLVRQVGTWFKLADAKRDPRARSSARANTPVPA